MTENVLIVGATSGIARELARVMAARGCNLALAARDFSELETIAADLRLRYSVRVEIGTFDALHPLTGSEMFANLAAKFADGLFGVVVCHGWMIPQSEAESDPNLTREMIDVNFTSAAVILTAAANYLAGKRHGYLAAISSVAGDRGRMSNYVYGASKAGLSAFLDGLRNRLYHEHVHVLSIKPGFVDTRMTEGLIDPRSPLVAQPQRVARDIDRAIRRRMNTVYTPWFWQFVMYVIRLIPETVFKRLRM